MADHNNKCISDAHTLVASLRYWSIGGGPFITLGVREKDVGVECCGAGEYNECKVKYFYSRESSSSTEAAAASRVSNQNFQQIDFLRSRKSSSSVTRDCNNQIAKFVLKLPRK